MGPLGPGRHGVSLQLGLRGRSWVQGRSQTPPPSTNISLMMKHFRVVTSISFGGGGKFVKNHNDEDPTPKFVIYLYNEKVLYSLQSTLDTHYYSIFHINIDIYYNIMVWSLINQNDKMIYISSSW